MEDFIVDDESWSISYIVVDMRNWLPSRRVLVSPQWIQSVSWDENKVFVDISRDAVKSSPAFNPSKPISLDYEEKLRCHLRKPEVKVWVTFKFHAPPKSKVFLAGTFNNWNPSDIRLGGDNKGTYSTAILLPVGRHEYKFIVNGEWRNSPDCVEHVPNPFGTTNSVLFAGPDTDLQGHSHTFARLSVSQSHPMWSTPMGG